TLFLTGQFIEKNPRLVLQMLADGHEIANHTYNHPHLTTFADNGLPETLEGADRDFLQGQLFRTDSLFRALTGIPMQPYWRAPYGEINPDILVWAAEAGYRHIHWSPGMDTMDWVSDSTSTLFRSPEAIAERLWEHARKKDGLNGGIVLMHLGTTRTGKPVYTILDALIRDLQKAGYRPVKISQMLENGTFPG
ncbi:MAG TPA: polysaccharide deacetylase family protein, partial [Calditrichia bacterium]|nr:polysaccharide deacetylase family protein [Calditrichia bacterium]